MFNGFNIEYPMYSVVTPQLGDQYEVRCLTVSEVDRIRHSNPTPNKVPGLVNDIIWKCLLKKPNNINTYDEFLKNVTLQDRAALIYGIYNTTFGNDKEFSVYCASCNNPQLIKFKLDNIFSMNPFPKTEVMKSSYTVEKTLDDTVNDPNIEKVLKEENFKDQLPDEIREVYDQNSNILTKRISKTLEQSKVIAVIKQPVLQDEEFVCKNIPFTNDQHIDSVLDTLCIDYFEYKPTPESSYVKLTNREDILKGYKTLPIKDKQDILDTFRDEFSVYGIKLETKWKCMNCGEENEFELNVVNQFFRMVQTL